MKTLKNESRTYVEQIVSAIESCYEKNAEPTNAQLTELYSLIGKCICQQGEKAFVAHLAKLLAEKLPQLGGFSMRNLRRMRGFYQTYENQPELLHKAQALGWTQNAVILDCCNTDEQRSFYIKLAAEKKLSKLVLMKAISAEIFEAETQETVVKECDHCRPVVGIATQEEAVDTTDVVKTQCGTFVTACEPLRQGDAPSMGDGISKASTDNLSRRLLAIPKAIEFTRKISVYSRPPILQQDSRARVSIDYTQP